MYLTPTYSLAAVIAYVYIGAVILTIAGLLTYWQCYMQANTDDQQDRVVMLTADMLEEGPDSNI